MRIPVAHDPTDDLREDSGIFTRALDRQEFTLLYQPQIDLFSGKIIGVEALIRWHHPKRGVLLPEDFLLSAESSKAIVPIGEWVLRKACQQQKAWQSLGLPPIVVSVNLSSVQFTHADIVRTVQTILLELDMEPQYLELEISENMVCEEAVTVETLFRLKQLGVSISLDNYGVGGSSIGDLKKLSIDKLKMDKSFLLKDQHEIADIPMMKTIIAIARNFRFQIVAEGVERKEHLLLLREYSFDIVQGHYISQPVTADNLLHLLREQHVLPHTASPENGCQKRISGLHKVHCHARQQMLESLRNQQGMVFTIIKKEGRFIHTSCEGEMLYRIGLVPESIIGKELYAFMPVMEAERKLQYYERAWNGEEHVTYESEMKGIHCLAFLRPIFVSGEVKEVIVYCVDITERKQAEEALRESEAKYRLIAESISDMICVTDRSGTITYFSPSISTNLGISPEEMQSRHFLSIVANEDKDLVRCSLQTIVDDKKPHQISFSGYHCDGTKLILEAKGAPVTDENGRVEKVVILLRNITSEVQTELFLRKMEKLSIIGHLIAGVAHEIRNPVTSIKGFLQLLRNQQVKEEYHDIMLAEFHRLENTLREFVFLTQEPPNHYEPYVIGNILQQLVAELQTELSKDSRIVLSCHISEPIWVWCNPDQIKQLFRNLLTNAMEAMPEGGVVRIEQCPETSDQVVIRIVDQGCGISEERLRRLGEPFYSTKEKGIGLGLMICYKIARYHQGMIHFSSQPGQGTSAEVTFPIFQVRSTP